MDIAISLPMKITQKHLKYATVLRGSKEKKEFTSKKELQKTIYLVITTVLSLFYAKIALETDDLHS